MHSGGYFLIVARENDVVRDVTRALSSAVTHRARSFEEALALLERGEQFDGVFMDSQALLGRELTRVRQVRELRPLLPMLLLCTQPTPEVINGAQLLRAELLCMPAAGNQLADFASRAHRAGRLTKSQLEQYLEELQHRKGLAERHVALVPHVLGEETAEQAKRRLGLDDDAFARNLRGLLKKCRTRSAEGLAKTVMREALLFGSPFPHGRTDEESIVAA